MSLRDIDSVNEPIERKRGFFGTLWLLLCMGTVGYVGCCDMGLIDHTPTDEQRYKQTRDNRVWAVVFWVLAMGALAVALSGCQLLDPGYQQPYQGGYQQPYYPAPQPEYQQPAQTPQTAQAAPQPSGAGVSTPPTAAGTILGQSGQPPNPGTSQPQANPAQSQHRPDIPMVGTALPPAGYTPPFVPPSTDPIDTGINWLQLLLGAVPGAGVVLGGIRMWRMHQQNRTFRQIAPMVHGSIFHQQPFDPQRAAQALAPSQQQVLRQMVPPVSVHPTTTV